jgi:hypothetical protein
MIGLFFFRTRETLILLPKAVLVASCCLFVYMNLTPYGFYAMAYRAYWYVTYGLILYCIQKFEIPAMQLSDTDFNKPTYSRPRALFQPLFSLT